jgi:hypothetical protein
MSRSQRPPPLLVLLLLGAAIAAVAQASHGAGPSHRLGFAVQVGVFPSLGLSDVNARDWRGFDGELFAGPRLLGSLHWNKFNLDGAVGVHWLNPHFVEDSAFAVEKSGDLVVAEVRGGPSVWINRRIELLPQVGYGSAHLGGCLELLDKGSARRHLVVDYSRWDRGPIVGLSGGLGQTINAQGNSLGSTWLRLQYMYAAALGGLHTVGIEFRFSERHNPVTKESSAVLLFARLSVGPSASTVLVGAGGSWGE